MMVSVCQVQCSLCFEEESVGACVLNYAAGLPTNLCMAEGIGGTSFSKTKLNSCLHPCCCWAATSSSRESLTMSPDSLSPYI